jgi:hypothetical protein
MSGIQLSVQLVADLKETLIKHDPAAENDLYCMQYLTAVTGFLLAHQTDPAFDKPRLKEDLCTFLGQVTEQVEQDLAPKPPADSAFGVWKPGQS